MSSTHPFYPRLYLSNLEKKSVFYLLCSPNSRLQTVSLSYLRVPSLCFSDGYLSFLDVLDIFTEFSEYTKCQNESSYLQRIGYGMPCNYLVFYRSYSSGQQCRVTSMPCKCLEYLKVC